MSKLLVYSVDGEILGNKTGPKWSLEQYSSDSEELCLIVEDGQDCGFHYVDAGALVEKPEQPSPQHTFNYATKQWVYDLSVNRDKKWLEIKSARSAEEFGTFVWNDHEFDCDELSQRRIQGAVQLAAIDPDMTLDWTLADNSVQTFTAAEYVQIGQALATHVSQCHERGRILRQQINQAATESELEAIVW